MFNSERPQQNQDGFSLLEILVAFSILAVSLGILMNIFSSGLRIAVVSDEYNSAVQIANSLMARTGVETPLQQEEMTGMENDKYRWQVIVSPFELTMDNIDANIFPAELYMVTVKVTWDVDNLKAGEHERLVELSTLKLTGKTNAPQSN